MHADVQIQKVVDDQLKAITAEIVRNVPYVDSIVLSGGFGRGEGSVRMNQSGGYVPLNDFDLYVFTRGSLDQATYSKMLREIYRSLAEAGFRGRDLDAFHIDVQVIERRSIARLNNDMSTYGLKTSSRVVWGKDIRNQIPIDLKDIPYTSVELNAPFHSALGLILNFELGFINAGPWKDHLARFNYECYKAYIAISTALGMLHRSLEFSHLKRANMIHDNYSRWFPDLADKLPSLHNDIVYYTHLKLNSISFDEERNPVQLWFKCKSDLTTVLQYVICRELNERACFEAKFSDYIYRRKESISSLYYFPYLRYMFERRHLPSGRIVLSAVMPFAALAMNFEYWRSHVMQASAGSGRLVFSSMSPTVRIFVSSALLLSSVGADGTIDRESAENARRLLEPLSSRTRAASSTDPWTNLRDICLESKRFTTRMGKTTL